ncbi:hypothetical protein Ferp_0460 [Ferroglobus placidus DSM 10642]|uniref:Uncharacterized protein n=1 Tax=Ferroglobus placidus (strain DSM 10642 / AEDII12DO) TaxID=589924 RepID=D3S301_FERPA|nr:hypothetical protein Ferp_0460 [Ferroglobus placidus DSM 10642]
MLWSVDAEWIRGMDGVARADGVVDEVKGLKNAGVEK